MKFQIERYGILVIPETDADEAYIEDTLGLRNEGDAIPLVRENAFSSHRIVYVTTTPPPHRVIQLVQPYRIPYVPLIEHGDDLITQPETPAAKKDA